MIKAIIFDCFGVLCLDSHQSLVEKFPEVGRELRDISHRSDYGLIGPDEFLAAAAELTNLSQAEVKEFVLTEHHKNQELLDYALTLRPRFKTAVLSNVGIGWFDEFITPTEQKKYFDVIVNSGREGIIKPDPEIFQITAERLGVSPNECVMIDDIDRNCAGAELTGMMSINFKDNAATIKRLEEIIFAEKVA